MAEFSEKAPNFLYQSRSIYGKSVFSPEKCDFLKNKLPNLLKKSDIFSDISVIFTLKKSFFKNKLNIIEKICNFLL